MKDTPREFRRFYRAAIWALILIIGGLVFREIFGQNGFLALRKQKQEYEALQQQIQQLKEEDRQLEKQVKALRSDPKAIEKLARDDMRLARPGEIIYTLPDKEAKAKSPSGGGKNSAPAQ